ncbi:hypothetical protein DFH08DRAFT_804823 [Mycena albidolilacea]|uniref:Uncharacterized protein n=1 Tax=Mycena albidolilacea TaxID=1033008 RepID=A0AAD7EVC6_9AGAR|nr:hypothetical protein DFH08DRAFT_804823 [Mycena albidolilacea]
MALKSWATDEQLAWLRDGFVADYLRRQAEKKLHLFWGPLHHQWFREFPEHAGLGLPLPGDENSRKLTDEETVILGAAIQSRKKASHAQRLSIAVNCTNTYRGDQKLENWFRSANSAKLGAMVDVLLDLKGKPKKRVHQAVEIFQRCNRDLIKDALMTAGYDKLNERDDEEDDWTDEADGSEAARVKAPKAQCMRMRTRVVSALWKEASKEERAIVLVEVKKEKEEMRAAELGEEEAEKEKEKTPGQLQDGIDALEAFFAKAHGAVYEGARWVGVMLVGGANPRMGGALSMKIICHGTTPARNDFEDSCVDFDKNVVEAFEGFLQQVFTPEECLARALEVKTPDANDASRPATVIQTPAAPPTALAAKPKPKHKQAKKKASTAAPATATAAAVGPPASAVETPGSPNSNGPGIQTAGQMPDDLDFGGDLPDDGGNAGGSDSESGRATGGATMASPIDLRLLGPEALPTRPRLRPAFRGAGATIRQVPASADSQPASSLPPFTPLPNAAQLALMGNTVPSPHVTPVAPPAQQTMPPAASNAVPSPRATPVAPPAQQATPPAASNTVPSPCATPVTSPTQHATMSPASPTTSTHVSPVAPPPGTMVFPDSRPFTQPPVDQVKKTKPGHKTPASKKSASKTSPGKAADNEAAAKAAQNVVVAQDIVQKKRGRLPNITNNNRGRARQAAAQAKAAEKAEVEKARAAQMAKGWMPGPVEGSVVLLRVRKPRAHPDSTLPPRVGEVAARRLDACEKALLERASAEKRKAAAAPSSSKAPSSKNSQQLLNESPPLLRPQRVYDFRIEITTFTEGAGGICENECETCVSDSKKDATEAKKS